MAAANRSMAAGVGAAHALETDDGGYGAEFQQEMRPTRSASAADINSPALDPATPTAVQRGSAVAPSPSLAAASPVNNEIVREFLEQTRDFASALIPAEPVPEGPTPDELENLGEKPASAFRYGEIFFEETGVKAPYLIVPEGAKAADLVTNMATFMEHGGETLCKPTILFEVRASGSSYMEQAKDVTENKFLAEMWFGGYDRKYGRPVEPITDKDQQVRKYCDRTLNVFKEYVRTQQRIP